MLMLKARISRTHLISLFLVLVCALFAGTAQATTKVEFTKQVVVASANSSAGAQPSGLYQSLNSSKVAQGQSSSGGGEGKPEDWDSPSRLRVTPTYSRQVGSQFTSLWPTLLNLLSWWY